jgi:hypothetical protein
LGKRIAGVSAADVRMRANEPALLDLVYRPIGRAFLARSDALGPERRFEVLPVLIQCQCVEGVLVVET